MKEKKITKKLLKKLARREDRRKLKGWAEAVKERDGRKCIFCGAIRLLNAHHLIPREIRAFRYEVDNGVSVCPKHHKFSFEFSAHRSPLVFLLWFRRKHEAQYNRLVVKWDAYISHLLGDVSDNYKTLRDGDNR